MRRIFHFTLIASIFSFHFANAQLNASTESKINRLLKEMTLEEKVGQMAQVAIDVIMPSGRSAKQLDSAKLYDVIINYKVGSILNTPPGRFWNAQQWNDAIVGIQNESQKSRLKIPVLYGLDDIHGVTMLWDLLYFHNK